MSRVGEYEALKARWGEIYPPTGNDWVECLNNTTEPGKYSVAFRRSDVLAFAPTLPNPIYGDRDYGALDVSLARAGAVHVVSVLLRRHSSSPEALFRLFVEGCDLPHVVAPESALPVFYDTHVDAYWWRRHG